VGSLPLELSRPRRLLSAALLGLPRGSGGAGIIGCGRDTCRGGAVLAHTAREPFLAARAATEPGVRGEIRSAASSAATCPGDVLLPWHEMRATATGLT
jgi:hypothetical protein